MRRGACLLGFFDTRAFSDRAVRFALDGRFALRPGALRARGNEGQRKRPLGRCELLSSRRQVFARGAEKRAEHVGHRDAFVPREALEPAELARGETKRNWGVSFAN